MASIQTPQELGEAVRIARKALALTQPQLALVAGVGIRFIGDLERGKPTVQLQPLLRVVAALGGELSIHGLARPSAARRDQRNRRDAT